MKHHFPTHGYDGYTRPLFVFHCAAVALCEQTGGGGATGGDSLGSARVGAASAPPLSNASASAGEVRRSVCRSLPWFGGRVCSRDSPGSNDYSRGR